MVAKTRVTGTYCKNQTDTVGESVKILTANKQKTEIISQKMFTIMH
jgi:hypothetical protein